MIGVNITPGWGNTVDGQDLPQMERVITDLRPGTLRMPWVENAATLDTISFAIANGIDTLVTDDHLLTPEEVVAGIVAAADTGFPVSAVEGVNEPDVPATGYTPTPVPITAAKLAEVKDRQQRLYDAVAGRWPVLGPSAVYAMNEPALSGLACDIASIHRYPINNDYPPTPESAVLPALDKPIWVTETGVTSYKKGALCSLGMGKYAVTPEQQRDYLLTQIANLRVNGAMRVLVYSMQNTGQKPCKPGNNFGLYTWDGVAKPAAVALRG